MNSDSNYDLTFSLVAGLGDSVEENTDFSSFLRIRRELNHFLLNLNHSNCAEGAGQQIHFLFMALQHLDNVEKEIRISVAGEELINLERIHDKIRGLKMLILNYIRQLTSEN
jgi:hypothetical protein